MEKNILPKGSKEFFLSDEDSDSISFDLPFPDPNPSNKIEQTWEKDDLEIPEFEIYPIAQSSLSNFITELEGLLKIPLPKDSISSLANCLQKLIQNQVECTLIDLKQLIDDCYKTIQNFENFHISNSSISLGNYCFKLKIDDSDLHVADKSEISKNFQATETRQKLRFDFPKSVIDYCEDYELDMIKAFESNTMQLNPQISAQFVNDIQIQNFKLNTLEQFNSKQEIQWQKQEIKTLKGQIKSKLQKILCKEQEMKKEFEKFKKDKVNLVKDAAKIEKACEDLNERKEKYSKFLDMLQKITSNLSAKNDSHMNSFASNSSFVSIDQSFTNDEEELKGLEQELKDLEMRYKTSPADSIESIQTKISRVRSRITGIKTEKMLSSSMNKSASIKNVMSAMQKVYSIKQPLPHKALTASHKSIIPSVPFSQVLNNSRRATISPLPFTVANDFARANTMLPELISPGQNRSHIGTPTTERLEIHAHQRSDGFYNSNYRKNQETEPRDSEATVKRSIMLKEARLQDKEEELSKKENWIRNNLERNFKDQEYLNLLKTEKMNLNRVKKELEVKERNIEEKMTEIEKIEEQVEARKKTLEKKEYDIEAEWQRLENDKEDLVVKIQEIKLFVQQNI